MHRLSAGISAMAPEGCVIILADLRLLPLDNALQPEGHLSEQLSPLEQQTLSTFSYRKRILEWLGGRLSAKEAVKRLLSRPAPPAPCRLSIIADDAGRPRLLTRHDHNIRGLSISHSHDFAAAMASLKGNCGIDIQKIVPKIGKVVEKFTDQHEKSLFCDNDPLVTLTTIWTAKEAIKKSLLHDQPSLFQGITIHGVRKESPQKTVLTCSLKTAADHKEIYVTAVKTHDYILSFTQEGPHA